MTNSNHRYTPKYRPMDSYLMKAYAADAEWAYVEAAQFWPNSPLPSSRFQFGVFETSRALNSREIENLEVMCA